jgi:hypothetical protein
MSFNIQAPSIQNVNTTEILQTGITQKTPLEKEDIQKRVKSFIAQHASKSAPTDNTGTENDSKKSSASVHAAPTQNVAGMPQVSGEEQQQAVLQKGGITTSAEASERQGKANAFKKVYRALYYDNAEFFELDMTSLLNAIRSKRKSVVDLADDLNPQQKSLRKYLLLEALKEQGPAVLTDGDRQEIQVHRTKILSEHGEFITGSLGAYNAGLSQKFQGPSLREFIRAYQMMEVQPNTSAITDIYNLYKTIKKDIQAGAPVEKLVQMQKGFINVLSREKTQDPSRITSPRHHMILSRIKQFGLLISLHHLHARFLKWGEKAKIQGLPNAVSLIETCLQVVLSNETLAGANALVAIASAVRSDHITAAKNSFISNYCRSVLLDDTIVKLYRNANQRKILVEHIERNTQLSAILAPIAAR